VALLNQLWYNTRVMSKATETAVRMIESLPESAQEKVVEELRALVEDVREEANWDELIERKKNSLVAAARKAREEIAAGKATDMDFDKL
jgi:DNA phosphorothioation-dependent restriction protein DptG